MKRGALIAALAVVVLLALCAQRWSVGSCDFEQRLITPDGQEFHFLGPRIAPGSLEADWPLDGSEGLPPVEHLSQQIYGMPGALFKGTVVKPRVLTITLTTHGLTRKALLDIRARMQGALRWDRGDPGDPSIYEITIDGVARQLYVHYDGDVKSSVGRPGLTNVIGIRMIAYDPFWYDPATQEQVLDWGESLSIKLVAERIGGAWDAMGPPAAVAVGAHGHKGITAIEVSPDGQYVYYGGDFTDFDNIPAADHIVRRNLATGTWEAVGGGLNSSVRDICFRPDGTMYVVGYFTNGSGGAGDPNADYVAQYDPVTDTFVNVGGGLGGTLAVGLSCLIGADGTLYVGGGAPNYIMQWTAAGGWATLGATNPNGFVIDLALLPNGHIAYCGSFTLIGVDTFNRIAEWDPGATAYNTLGDGFDNSCRGIAVGADGTLYAGGDFGASGAVTCLRVARWNGVYWSAIGDLSGPAGAGYVVRLFVHPITGEIYASGPFEDADGMPLADYFARFNGSSWLAVGVIPLAMTWYSPKFAFSSTGDLYLGLDYEGALAVVGSNSVVNVGNAATYPTIEIKNQGHPGLFYNESTGQYIEADMEMLDGEIVTIDLSSGVKSCESTWRGNRLGDILAASDMATFCLESYPRAQYGGEGGNLVTLFITDAIPRESGDNNNQVSAWEVISGISQANTDLGRLYVNIVAEGAGVYHLDFYMDAAKAAGDLVAHSDSYNAPGAVNINPDNASGLGGQVLIDNVVGADTDIMVWYTIVTLTWRNRWWDLDTAVS